MPEEISSVESLQSVIRSIQEKHPHVRLAFRGQRRDLFPIPSAQRPFSDLNYQVAHQIFHSAWLDASASLLSTCSRLDHPLDRVTASMAILQHYGFRSWFVDVTADPTIAAWFALHNYEGETALVQQDDASIPAGSPLHHAFAMVSMARYRRVECDDGILYVFAASPLNTFWLCDQLPTSALRVHRQRAGALVAPMNGASLDSTLIAKLTIDRHFAFPSDLDAQWLFPSPTEDEVYKRLLRVPYVVPEEQFDLARRIRIS